MTATARAAVLDSIGAEPTIRNVVVDDPQPNEVLVRIVASGICHTDLAVAHGQIPTRFPVVLGHEGAGIVDAVGTGVQDLAPGDRVVLSFASCGTCRACLEGAPAYCEQLPQLNLSGRRPDKTTTLSEESGVPVHGSFFGQSSWASHALTNARNIVKVPRDFPLELAAPLGCGIQTGAGAVLNTLSLAPGASIVITGAGAVGLSAVMAARLSRASKIIAVDLLPARRDAATRLGATAALDGATVSLAEDLRTALGGFADAAVDTTAVPDVLAAAASATRQGGVVVSLGVPRPGAAVPLTALNGKTLKCVLEGDSIPHVFIPQLIQLHRSGEFPIDELVTTFDFAEVGAAIEATSSGRAIKAVMLMERDGT